MFLGIGRGRGPQAMHAQAVHLDPHGVGPLSHDCVNPVTRYAGPGGFAPDRAEQRAVARRAVGVALQVRIDPLGGDRVQR